MNPGGPDRRGWQKQTDQWNREFYVNHSTRTTQWEVWFLICVLHVCVMKYLTVLMSLLRDRHLLALSLAQMVSRFSLM